MGLLLFPPNDSIQLSEGISMIIDIEKLGEAEKLELEKLKKERPVAHTFLTSQDIGMQISAIYKLKKDGRQNIIDIIAKRGEPGGTVREVVLSNASQETLKDIFLLLNNDRIKRIETLKYINNDRFLYTKYPKEKLTDVKIAIVNNLKNTQLLTNIRRKEENPDIIEAIDDRIKDLNKKIEIAKKQENLRKNIIRTKSVVLPMDYQKPTKMEKHGGYIKNLGG